MSAVASLRADRQIPREWPLHDAGKVARDFGFWRHIRVARARLMRHVHRVASLFSWTRSPAPAATAYGVVMHPDWRDRSYAYCHYGTYGPYLANIIRSIECPFVFVDLGANQGVFSLIAARQPACKRVVAVEPVAATFDRLVSNIALNNAQDRVTALELAVSDRSGVRMMRRRRVHSGVATIEDRISTGDPGSISQPVNVCTITDLCRHVPEGLPLFVKVDVSGHEATVIEELLGAPCARRIIGVFYAEDDRWCDTARLGRALTDAGFAPIRVFGRPGQRDVLAVRGPCVEPPSQPLYRKSPERDIKRAPPLRIAGSSPGVSSSLQQCEKSKSR